MMDSNLIIAHLYERDGAWVIQSNSEHCFGTARLACEFASQFDMGAWGYFIGLLHDRGKERNGFQSYIRCSSGLDKTSISSDRKDHSHIGAKIARRTGIKDDFFWLSNPIAGHHGGLYNTDELLSILNQVQIPKEVNCELPKKELPLPNFHCRLEDISHISRMLFSCLVDADWLDTEGFMNPEKKELRMRSVTMEELDDILERYLKKLNNLPYSQINNIRRKVQQSCAEAGIWSPGFFTLTVPTGGGKTIASVLWALKHAVCYKKNRIIIAIPYTSIIVQTARVLKNIFGESNVIEHHSALNENEIDESNMFACENWDAPIIVTTNVQLFESMFSNKRSVCRKLHSLANSVVILDEIQTLPSKFLQPITDALKTYSSLFKTSFLFTTASQPILDGEWKGTSGSRFVGIERQAIRDIISEKTRLHDRLRRVTITHLKEVYDYSSLSARLSVYRRVLCIVNTRKQAKELYDAMPCDGIETIHLSRSMCQQHILTEINRIKDILKDPNGAVRVISTQLIEAGVDIDFPVVFRQLAGLDSILQAAGRCNREGLLDEGITFMFSLKNEKSNGAIGSTIDTMKDLLRLYPDLDWFSPEAMRLYFEKLYSRINSFDENGINDLLINPKECQYEEASRKFRLIEDEGRKIIVNFANAEQLVKKLVNIGPSLSLSRSLGQLSVSVPERAFKDLINGGLVVEPVKGFYYIPLKSQYDEKSGLKYCNNYLEETYII